MGKREEVLSSLIGKPWVANAKGPDAFDCYHLTQYVERVLFNTAMPDFAVPNNPTWRFILEQLQNHPFAKLWKEVPTVNGLVTAKDGAIVLMSASKRPAHMGVWFKKEMCILHTDEPDGVVFHDLPTIRMLGWGRLNFMERLP